jgi:hypothetical protein
LNISGFFRSAILTGVFKRTIAAAAFAFAMHAGWAQEWEIGGVVGYGAYKNGSVQSASGTVTAGVRNRFVAGAQVTEDMFEHISGEIRYLYHDGDPFLSNSSSMGNVQGQSHSLDYTALFHARPRASRLRPYLLVGGGGKYYRVTGPTPNPQPFPKIAALTNQSEWEFMVVAGGGVKYRVLPNVVIRGEFRDYITPLPSNLFRGVTGSTTSGIFHQFTPVFGVSYSFGLK